jgi:hypothetical protein
MLLTLDEQDDTGNQDQGRQGENPEKCPPFITLHCHYQSIR